MKKKNTAIFLVMLALACGLKRREEGPGRSEAQAATQASPEPKEELKEAPVPPPDETSVFARIPDTAFFALHMGRPARSIGYVGALLKKLGLPSSTPELEKMKEETGLDIYDPAFLKKIGVDDARGLTLVLDSGPLLQIKTPDYTHTGKVAPYLVVPLSDPTTFLQWMAGMMAASGSEVRLERATLGDREVSYLYRPAEGGEWLEGALVAQEDLLYVFLSAVGRPVPTPATPPEAVEAYKKEMEAFFGRVDKPLGKDATFLRARAKTEAESDLFFYMRFSKASPLLVDAPEDLESYQAVADLFPAMAGSMRLEKKGISARGVLRASPSLQQKLRKTLLFSDPVPPYATLFPQDTGLFYRFNLNLLGLKEVIFEALPPEERADAESSFAQVSALLDSQVGFELEKEVLGGLSGHFAFGASGVEGLLALLYAPKTVTSTGADESGERETKKETSPLPEILPMMLVAQAKSAKSGARLIEIMEKGLDMLDVTPTREEVGGHTIYSVTPEGEDLTFSFTRYEGLLAFSNSKEALKGFLGRAKTPGASFVDELGGEAVKELVAGEAQSGLVLDLSRLFRVLAKAPGQSPVEKMIFTRLSSLVRVGVFAGAYEEGSIISTVEITLR